MNRTLLVALIGALLVLSACATKPALTPSPASVPSTLIPSLSDTIPAGTDPFAGGTSTLTRVDEQGAIVVEVTPKNLNRTADRIEFDVALNTHSVDLSMDLAPLSTLTTDTGMRVQAQIWDAPLGGHHTGGTLIFPLTAEELPLLDQASRLTLTIADLDAASRVFEWALK